MFIGLPVDALPAPTGGRSTPGNVVLKLRPKHGKIIRIDGVEMVYFKIVTKPNTAYSLPGDVPFDTFAQGSLPVNRPIFFEKKIMILAVVPTRLTSAVVEQCSGPPGEGTTPGVGEGTTPGVGEGTTPGVGEGTTPGVGEGTTPSVGEGTTPGVGEGTTPGVGEGTTPGVGEGTTPGVGEGTTPGVGEGTTPGVGEGTTPGVGEGTTPGAPATGGPGEGTTTGTPVEGCRAVTVDDAPQSKPAKNGDRLVLFSGKNTFVKSAEFKSNKNGWTVKVLKPMDTGVSKLNGNGNRMFIGLPVDALPAPTGGRSTPGNVVLKLRPKHGKIIRIDGVEMVYFKIVTKPNTAYSLPGDVPFDTFAQGSLPVNRPIFFEKKVMILAVVPTRLTSAVVEQCSGPPGEGTTPGVGEGTTPGVGEGTTPGVGEGTTPGVGEGTTPGVGEGTTPGVGEGTTPGVGEGTTPGVGEGTTPGVGEGTTPGVGEGTTPGVGEGTTPGVGEGTTPGPGVGSPTGTPPAPGECRLDMFDVDVTPIGPDMSTYPAENIVLIANSDRKVSSITVSQGPVLLFKPVFYQEFGDDVGRKAVIYADAGDMEGKSGKNIIDELDAIGVDNVAVYPIKAGDGATMTAIVFTLNGKQDVDSIFPSKKQNYDLEELGKDEQFPDIPGLKLALVSKAATVKVYKCEQGSGVPTPPGPGGPTTPGPGEPTGPGCVNLGALRPAQRSKMPVGNLLTETAGAAAKGKGYRFVVGPEAKGRVTLSLAVPLGGELAKLGLVGSYAAYKVFVVDADGKRQVVQDSRGKAKIRKRANPATYKDVTIPSDGEIEIVVFGPEAGFRVKIATLELCNLPDVKFCRLGNRAVKNALNFKPLNNELGLNSEKETVMYGDNGDFIQSGVTIVGSCYECQCDGDTLKCTKTANCRKSCPAHTSECVGTCAAAVRVATFAVPGVHPKCKIDETPCVPDSCTTPAQCPGPWNPWSECKGCLQFRSRDCQPGCEDACAGRDLAEVRACPNCPVAPPPGECGKNQVLTCVNPHDECQQSCAVLMKKLSCEKLMEDGEKCVQKCACKDGFMMNVRGDCVPKRECECYQGQNGNTPIPQGYRVQQSKCVLCECTEDGYNCRQLTNCCELTDWSDWSECSKGCGKGTKTRSRKQLGLGCKPGEKLVETEECQSKECPCVHNGRGYESGEVYSDSCKTCKCTGGDFQCTELKPKGEIWPNTDCTRNCRCNETGFEECFEDIPAICKQNKENCNSETHVLKPTDNACCPQCVPIAEPCARHSSGFTNDLTLVHPRNGRCQIKERVEIAYCSGTCGSKADSAEWVYKGGRFQLSVESGCECCKPVVKKQPQTFVCANDRRITKQVDYIESCGCAKCGGD